MVRNAILDKNVVVPEGVQVGVDKEHDRARGFVVSDGGVTVVGKGQKVTAVTAAPADGCGVALLTREYPPEVYGGAGVHVEYLARELAGLVGPDRALPGRGPGRGGGAPAVGPAGGANPALQTISTDLSMTAAAAGADLVHSHTWYANLAGHLAALLYGIPHVVTVHSLEPLRPWKAEQLGGGYALSSWCERVAVESAAAVIAVSDGMRADVLAAYPAVPPERVQVIRNGIDTGEYAPDPGTDVLERYGVDPAGPSVVFVGRITRQKGLPVLLRAAAELDPAAQLVLCAGQPDTAELAAEVTALVDRPAGDQVRGGLAHRDAGQARGDPAARRTRTVFACPSLYEPLGIVNLEAMACGTAVVGVPGRRHPRGGGGRRDRAAGPAGRPGRAGRGAQRAGADPDRAAAMGRAGRARAVADFGWATIAAQTVALYPELTGSNRPRAGRLTGSATGTRWPRRGTGRRGRWCPPRTRNRQLPGVRGEEACLSRSSGPGRQGTRPPRRPPWTCGTPTAWWPGGAAAGGGLPGHLGVQADRGVGGGVDQVPVDDAGHDPGQPGRGQLAPGD